MNAYPLKFTPILKEKIWGGQRLNTLLGKDLTDMENAGESWELSAVEGSVSIVENGELRGLTLSELVLRHGAELVGNKVFEEFGTEFPLLVKFIDAADNLSVQVHPTDESARQCGLRSGKTEMWYVLDSQLGGKLISGFNKQIKKADYERLLASGDFFDALASIEVEKGDVVFVPAGRIHAIGRGVMVAEIQQTSDITYRVFDYNRTDAQGNHRELHVAEAREAINFSDTDNGLRKCSLLRNERIEAVDCQYFNAGIIEVQGKLERNYSELDSFVILMCVEGNATVNGEQLRYGETCLIPACLKCVSIEADEVSKLIEVYIA